MDQLLSLSSGPQNIPLLSRRSRQPIAGDLRSHYVRERNIRRAASTSARASRRARPAPYEPPRAASSGNTSHTAKDVSLRPHREPSRRPRLLVDAGSAARIRAASSSPFPALLHPHQHAPLAPSLGLPFCTSRFKIDHRTRTSATRLPRLSQSRDASAILCSCHRTVDLATP